MRAVRWHARGDVRVDDVPIPTPGVTEVLLRVEAAAICGTDVDEVRLGPITVPIRPHPVNGRTAPMTLGHEIVGVVAEAGTASGQVVGARVAPWPSQPCGRCRECTTGHANRCPLMVALGMSTDGGMADCLVADGPSCVPVGAEVEPERAVLVEPFAVALHALHRTPVAGRRVAVVGIGSLGLCVIEAAVLEGAGEVVAVSRSERAREVAREAGAAATLPPDRASEVDAEVVFETAGAAPAVAASFAAVRRGGRVVVLGGHPRTTGLDLLDLTVREVALEGSVSHCFDDFRRAAEGITSGTLARTRRPIALAPLEDGPALLQTDDTSVKRVLVPGLR
jgi:(R,R)-butanediol dehydrogenase/meso-butanediol dehydrogenase/diacetyl reductase